VEELESTVAELEETLQKQQEEALDAVNQWSTMYSQLETLKSELEETLQKQQEEALDAVNQWSTRYSELETLKSELEVTLQKQQEEAQYAVNQLSTRYSELEILKSEVEQELEMVSRERDELSGMLESERESIGKDAVSRVENDFAEAKADWDSEKERLQSQVVELKAAALVSSQNLVAAEEQVSRMKSLATEKEAAWKGKFYMICPLLDGASIHSDVIFRLHYPKVAYQNLTLQFKSLNRPLCRDERRQAQLLLNGNPTAARSRREQLNWRMS
jgi:chromosome segregation ATPase